MVVLVYSNTGATATYFINNLLDSLLINKLCTQSGRKEAKLSYGPIITSCLIITNPFICICFQI